MDFKYLNKTKSWGIISADHITGQMPFLSPNNCVKSLKGAKSMSQQTTKHFWYYVY